MDLLRDTCVCPVYTFKKYCLLLNFCLNDFIKIHVHTDPGVLCSFDIWT